MRNILITGSSHGIGAGCAVAFARDEGANIGICGNKDAAGAEAVARECEKFGVKTKVYLGDVGTHDFCKATMEDFISTFGKTSRINSKLYEVCISRLSVSTA